MLIQEVIDVLRRGHIQVVCRTCGFKSISTDLSMAGITIICIPNTNASTFEGSGCFANNAQSSQRHKYQKQLFAKTSIDH